MAHVILASAQGPNASFFFFGGTFIRLGGLLGQGLGLGLGPGLDNKVMSKKDIFDCLVALNRTSYGLAAIGAAFGSKHGLVYHCLDS